MKYLGQIIKRSLKKGASDIHFKSGTKPIIRVRGELYSLDNNLETLDNEMIEHLAKDILNKEQWKEFLKAKEMDVAYSIAGIGRFRVNLFHQRGSISIVIRNIPFNIPSIDELNLPEMVQQIAHTERGLILVTGITGSGKSTTLASMINHINHTFKKHIITIEDPIEFLIRDKSSIISQREIGQDTNSFASALRSALRQDPDVILIGEMRDQETIETALTAAETGHLVFSTLHTSDAKESINRILGSFEPHQHHQIRLQLAASLKSIISQRLAKSIDQSSYYPAVEILINNDRIADMILNPSKTEEITTAIEQSHTSFGMQSFDQSLMRLISQGKIALKEALKLSTRPNDFELRYKGISNIRNSEYKNFENSTVGNVTEVLSDKLDIVPINEKDNEKTTKIRISKDRKSKK